MRLHVITVYKLLSLRTKYSLNQWATSCRKAYEKTDKKPERKRSIGRVDYRFAERQSEGV